MKKASSKKRAKGTMQSHLKNRILEVIYPEAAGVKVIGPKPIPVDETGLMSMGYTVVVAVKKIGYYGVHHFICEEVETVKGANTIAESIGNRILDIKKGNTVEIND